MRDGSVAREVVPAGVGPDGAMFTANDPAGHPVTVYRLRPADEKIERRRARRFDVIASWDIPGSLAIRKVDLTGRRLVIVERAAPTLDVALAAGIGEADALKAIHEIAGALCSLHRAGLVHGSIEPATVSLRAAGAALDVTGLRCTTPADALTRACRRAEDEERPSADVWSLGVLLLACIAGPAAVQKLLSEAPSERGTVESGPGDPPVLVLAREMTQREPAFRPSAADVARRLAALRGVAAASTPSTASKDPLDSDADEWPEQLGRFKIIDLLGEGAMGRVYKGVHLDTGEAVAVKVLTGAHNPTQRSLRRFKKEVRILGEIRHPNVARLVDAGEDGGRLWMAVEYVEGETLSAHISRRGPLPENEALGMIADLCKALVDVHDRGVVHRDVKPDNVLVTSTSGARVKLIDFGIARHLDESESLAMTRQGAVLGTPLYMSPEQARGEAVDARSDVYALGSVLFELLAGKAPFSGGGASRVIAMQIETVPPRITEVRPEVSDEVARVIARALEKAPAARYQNARELLDALQALLDEKPATIAAHPRPTAPPSNVMRWAFAWDLRCSPAQLWPHVSNTERLNRAIGLPVVDEESFALHGDDAEQRGQARQAGFSLSWRENPHEWVLERRVGVLREYDKGPVRSMRSTMDLAPKSAEEGGGTHLVHVIEVEPRGLLARAASLVEVGVRTRRGLDRVYRRIDDLVFKGASPAGTARTPGPSGSRPDDVDPLVDVFEPVTPLTAAREQRFAQLEQKVVDAGADVGVVARLGDFLRAGAAQDVARIRPIALARRLGLDENACVRACLIAAREGILQPLWDLLCPACRAPAGIEETLRAVKDHAHCDVCNIDFALDLASSIELVFRVHPQLREVDAGTYCLSSPAKTPHVVAQVRAAAGERFALEVALPDGGYQLTGRRLPYSIAFRVRPEGAAGRWEISLKDGPPAELGRVFASGKQEIVLVNDTGREQLVRIERSAARDDVLTAARAAANPLFRQLFPNEVLEPGTLVRVASVVLLHADVQGAVPDDAAAGDPQSFSTLYGAYKAIEAGVARAGGSVVKLIGTGALAIFDDPAAAVACGLTLHEVVRAVAPHAVTRVGLHRGPAAAVTLNERLDYFGKTVDAAVRLACTAPEGGVVVSDALLADPAVQEQLDRRARAGKLPAIESAETNAPLAIA